MSHTKASVKGNLALDTFYQRGFSLSIPSHKGHLLSSMNGEVDIVEDIVVAIVLGHIFANDGIVSASHTAGELQMEGAVVHLVHLDGNHAFKLLQSALHLNGLGGLVTETVHKGTDVGNLLLLVLVCPKLLLPSFGTQIHIFVILYLIVIKPAAGDFKGAVGHIIYKGSVVADQHHGTSAAYEKLLQPLDTLNVKVVGRLVEQQHIGPLEQKFCQFYAHSPSTAELAGGSVKVFSSESQSLKGSLQFRLVIQSANHLETLAFVGKAFHKLHVRLRFIIGTFVQLALHFLQFLFCLMQMRKSLFGFLSHGSSVREHHYLGQIGHLSSARHHGISLRGQLQSGHDFEHGTLSCTVLSHQGNTILVAH